MGLRLYRSSIVYDFECYHVIYADHEKTQSTMIHDFNERSEEYRYDVLSVLNFFTKAFDIISETKQNIILNILPLLSFFFNYLSKIGDKFILRINRCLFYYDLM